MSQLVAEQQQSSGFIISKSLKEIIDSHRNTMDKNPMNLQLQQFLIHNANIE
jgi:hypothetical protein